MVSGLAAIFKLPAGTSLFWGVEVGQVLDAMFAAARLSLKGMRGPLGFVQQRGIQKYVHTLFTLAFSLFCDLSVSFNYNE